MFGVRVLWYALYLQMEVLAMTPLAYTINNNVCSKEQPFLTLWNRPLHECVVECRIRKFCKSVNFWRRRVKCEMMTKDSGEWTSKERLTQPCVFIDMAPVKDMGGVFDVCDYCEPGTVCNTEAETCDVRECPELHVTHVMVKGNVLSVASRLIVLCDQFYELNDPTLQPICLKNGTWGNVPNYTKKAPCPIGWHQIGDSCYFTSLSKMNASAARTFCHDQQAYLVQYETPEEYSVVKRYLVNTYGNKQYLLGLTDEETEGIWKWMETDTLTSFTAWNTCEPNRGTSQNYAVIWAPADWADIPGYHAYTPVCEKSVQNQ